MNAIFNLLFFFLLYSASIINAYPHWDTEYWQMQNIKNWEKGAHKIYSLFDFRYIVPKYSVYFTRYSGCYAYKAQDYLTLEVHYTFIKDIPRGAKKFIDIHRLELEFNPSHTFANGIAFRTRNRFELRKRSNNYFVEYIFRQRSMIAFPIHSGKLTELRIYNELFYDFNNQKFIQNRFYPLELHFKVNKRCYFNIYCMMRQFYSFNLLHWFNNVVIGTEMGF